MSLLSRSRINESFIIVFLTLGLLITGCGNSGSDLVLKSENGKHSITSDKLFKTWKINDYKGGQVAAITGDQAEAFLATDIKIERDSAKYFGDECDNISYEYQYSDSPDDFLYGYSRANKRYLEIDIKEIRALTVKCEEKSGSNFTLFLLDNENKAVVIYKGVFFYAKKEPWYSWLFSWF